MKIRDYRDVTEGIIKSSLASVADELYKDMVYRRMFGRERTRLLTNFDKSARFIYEAAIKNYTNRYKCKSPVEIRDEAYDKVGNPRPNDSALWATDPDKMNYSDFWHVFDETCTQLKSEIVEECEAKRADGLEAYI